jgi:hypothetical protein
MHIQGDGVQLVACRFTVRGSFPYGYGNIYGIGRGNVVGLKKHCGILVKGDHAVIDGCTVTMEAFGHAIFMQGADGTVVRNTQVVGGVRRSDELYAETHAGDLARKFDYRMQWPEEVKGLPIPRGHMINLTEDGIRAYAGTGHVTVENCQVLKMRGGIKLYMARSAAVSNCEVRDCVIQGFSLPSRGTLDGCRGNAAYGPLLYIHFDSHHSQRIDLQVLPSPHGLGDHPLAAIKGSGHRIRLIPGGDFAGETLRPVIVGYPLRFDFLCVDYPAVPQGYASHFARHAPETYRASGINIHNETIHPVVLGIRSRENDVTSLGPVQDDGANHVRAFTALSNR